MSTVVQCSRCSTLFNTTGRVAGRRVRCRNCRAIIQVPKTGAAGARSEDEVVDGEQLERLDSIDFAPADPLDLSVNCGGAAPAVMRSSTQVFAPDPDAIFAQASTEFEYGRSAAAYNFPYSREIDRWLPVAMFGAAMLWLAHQAVLADNGLPVWAGLIRLAVLLVGLFGVVVPVTYIALVNTARNAKYRLPPAPFWRVTAVVAVPYATAAAMWLIDGGLSNLIIGCLVGLLLSLPALWLLLRLDPQDGPSTLTVAAGSFLGSSLLVAGLVLGINAVAVGTMRRANSPSDLAVSPLGPGLTWVSKTEVAGNNKPPKKVIAAAVSPGVKGGAAPTTQSAPRTRESAIPPTGVSDPASTTQPVVASPGGTPPVSTPPVATTDPTTSQPVVPVVVQPQPTTPPVPEPIEVASVDPVPPDGSPTSPTDPAAPIELPAVVKSATFPLRGYEQFAFPLTPGPWIGAVRKSANGGDDEVQRWDAASWKPQGHAAFASGGGGGSADGAYHVSPDGAHVSRVAKFPNLQIQTWSFVDQKLLPSIRLDPRQGAPTVLGYAGNDQVVVHVKKEKPTLEVWNVRTGRWSRRVSVSDFDPTPSNFAISDDGRVFAAVTNTQSGGEGMIEVYGLNPRERASAKIPIKQLDWSGSVKVAGITISPDRGRVAVLFVQGGQGLFVCWNLTKPDAEPIEHLYPGGLADAVGSDASNFKGSALHFVDDARGWLMYGTAVYDTRTGRPLGTLGLTGVRRQWVRGDQCYLVQQKDGTATLAVVTLDAAKLRVAVGSK